MIADGPWPEGVLDLTGMRDTGAMARGLCVVARQNLAEAAAGWREGGGGDSGARSHAMAPVGDTDRRFAAMAAAGGSGGARSGGRRTESTWRLRFRRRATRGRATSPTPWISESQWHCSGTRADPGA